MGTKIGISQKMPTPVINGFTYSHFTKSGDRYNKAVPPLPATPEPINAYQWSPSFHTCGSRKSLNPAGGVEMTGFFGCFRQVFIPSLLVARQMPALTPSTPV